MAVAWKRLSQIVRAAEGTYMPMFSIVIFHIKPKMVEHWNKELHVGQENSTQ